MVFMHPDNRPDDYFGQALDDVAAAYSEAVGPRIAAADAAALDGASRGEVIEPDAELAMVVGGVEVLLNGMGALYRFIQAASPEELQAAFPDYDFTELLRTRAEIEALRHSQQPAEVAPRPATRSLGSFVRRLLRLPGRGE